MQIVFFREGEKGNILIGIDFTASSGVAGGGQCVAMSIRDFTAWSS